MVYNPATDFPALARSTANGVRFEQMPGLDFIIAGLARAGMFLLSTGSTAPDADQTTTVWLKIASNSWSAESAVYLWDAGTATYVPATPALWQALFEASA